VPRISFRLQIGHFGLRDQSLDRRERADRLSHFGDASAVNRLRVGLATQSLHFHENKKAGHLADDSCPYADRDQRKTEANGAKGYSGQQREEPAGESLTRHASSVHAELEATSAVSAVPRKKRLSNRGVAARTAKEVRLAVPKRPV
jgi:hypothetical protein